MAANAKYNRTYSSSFNLHLKRLTHVQAQIVLTKLEKEAECNEYDHPEEKKRFYNLITYLHYFRRNIQEATLCNKKALDIDHESIVAHGTQAWIYYLEHDPFQNRKQVEQILKKVDELCTDRVKLVVAKSEIAYSYARFGLLYYAKAETIYEEVLNDVESKDITSLYVAVWLLINKMSIIAQSYNSRCYR
ncbi:hypothetical protein CHS0354_035490 [Potamilus streckersoni]|uniref:Uncharacterized protein n=1 Tax=Potamilus streckersoni TaxID=2493646 RepID=A0AAE0RVI8_9BIVA|nr:hypothetical protein CHS0354_035490 [Potamilus streckersoni]